MPQEFLIKFDKDIPDEVTKGIEEAVRSAALSKIASLDLSRNMTISSDLSELRELLGGGHTVGMFIR